MVTKGEECTIKLEDKTTGASIFSLAGEIRAFN